MVLEHMTTTGVAKAVGTNGLKTLAAKTLAVMATPAFGIASLVAIVGFEYWKGLRDAQQFGAAQAKEKNE